MPKPALFMLSFIGLFLNTIAAAEEFGTSDEASAMLGRAIAVLKVEKQVAIASFNHNDPAFRDRDLFVFCFNAYDGKFTAHEAFVGSDVRSLVDRRGYQYGTAMFNAPNDGRAVEIAYSSPVPGATFQVRKRAHVARIGDQVCGVSFYLYNAPGEPTQ